MKTVAQMSVTLMILLNWNLFAKDDEVSSTGKALAAVAENFVSAVDENDTDHFSKLFAPLDDYFADRLEPAIKLGKSSKAFKYRLVKKQFVDDLHCFYDPALPARNLRLESVRVIGAHSRDRVGGLEIKINFGSGSGLGKGYIITGPLIRTAKGWVFVERCRELFNFVPYRSSTALSELE